MTLPSLKDIGVEIARAILPQSIEKKLGIAPKTMTFEVGERLTPEQTKEAYETLTKPSNLPEQPLNYKDAITIFSGLSAQKRMGQPLAREDQDLLFQSFGKILELGFMMSPIGITAGKTTIPVKGISAPATKIPIFTPITRIINALREAKPLRAAQEAIYTAERAKRFGAAEKIGEEIGGEKGFYAELSKLKGIMPKITLEPIKNKISQSDIDSLFQQVANNPWFTYIETIEARKGLIRMLGGSLPTNSQMELLNKAFPPELINMLRKKQPILKQLSYMGGQLANIPRSIMSSFDFSFGGRQGLFAAPTYRKEFWNAWKQQFKNFGDEKMYEATMEKITQNPYFNLLKEGGVSFTNVGEVISQREERFASQWAERIPIIGKVVAASNRAYTGFANTFRVEIGASMIENLKKTGEPITADKIKAISNLVNLSTGRGGLGPFGRAADFLNAFFYSPRLMSSRMQLLANPNLYIKAPPPIRKQALSMLFNFAAYVMTGLTLAKLAGLEVNTDCRSADFTKIKIGNTRIEITGGFQPYIRATCQLISGQYVSSTTGKIVTLGEGYKPLTRMDILTRFAETKEAPIFSFINTLLKGQDIVGRPIEISKEIGQRFVPMVVADIVDIAKDDPRLLPYGILGIFGFGLQTYSAPPKTPESFPSFKGEEAPNLPSLKGAGILK